MSTKAPNPVDRQPRAHAPHHAGHEPGKTGRGAGPDIPAGSEGLALTRAFTRIGDAKMRRSIVELVERIASREGPDPR